MVIVELQQPNYNATIEAIAQAVLASLRPGAATDKLLAVAVEMSTKLTTHIEDFDRLANDGSTRSSDQQRRCCTFRQPHTRRREADRRHDDQKGYAALKDDFAAATEGMSRTGPSRARG